MLTRLLKLSISIVFYFVYSRSGWIFRLFKNNIPGTITILTYHSVKPYQCQEFEKQMDCLLKVGRAVFADISDSLSSRQHHIGVTFDDGFQSLLLNALPAMRVRNIPVIIFVTTGNLAAKPHWLRGSNHKDVDEVLFTKEQLRLLPENLVTIGSHCVTHLNLTEIDANSATRELVDSKETLEQILGRKVNLLSFPHGAYNQKIIDLSKSANYDHVFSNIPTFSFSNNGDYLMSRISISLDDWMIEFRLKILGAYQWLSFAVKLKHRIKAISREVLEWWN
jgi:peptidoglycan/xylan/chitin deacetylase (PgdA/CDA1 family)